MTSIVSSRKQDLYAATAAQITEKTGAPPGG